MKFYPKNDLSNNQKSQEMRSDNNKNNQFVSSSAYANSSNVMKSYQSNELCKYQPNKTLQNRNGTQCYM